jgi:hypothetical protein
MDVTGCQRANGIVSIRWISRDSICRKNAIVYQFLAIGYAVVQIDPRKRSNRSPVGRSVANKQRSVPAEVMAPDPRHLFFLADHFAAESSGPGRHEIGWLPFGGTQCIVDGIGGPVMVELYVSGRRIGSWADGERLLAGLAIKEQIEFRDETGRTLGRFVPVDPSPFPYRSEIDRRCATGGGILLAEFWKKMGVE